MAAAEAKALKIPAKARLGSGVGSGNTHMLQHEPPSPMSHAGILARHATYRLTAEQRVAASPPPAAGKEIGCARDKKLVEAASPRTTRHKKAESEKAVTKPSSHRKFSFAKFGLFSGSSSPSQPSHGTGRRQRSEGAMSEANQPPPSPPTQMAYNVSPYQVTPARSILAREPLLPPRHDPNDKRVALVLDLDETLVRSSFDMTFEFDFEAPFTLNGCWCKARVRKRPHVDDFLRRVSKHFELIVMTAGVQPYASLVLDILDSERVLEHRFYRDACTKTETGILVKDLSRMSRPMDQIIIVDNSPNAYLWHPENAIDIKDFVGDQRDTDLITVADFLEVIKDADDVRPHLQHWKRGTAYAERYDKTKRAVQQAN